MACSQSVKDHRATFGKFMPRENQGKPPIRGGAPDLGTLAIFDPLGI